MSICLLNLQSVYMHWQRGLKGTSVGMDRNAYTLDWKPDAVYDLDQVAGSIYD